MYTLLISLALLLSKEKVKSYNSCISNDCEEFAPYHRDSELPSAIYWLVSEQDNACVVDSRFNGPAVIGTLVMCDWRRPR